MAITIENQYGDVFNVGVSFVSSIDVAIDFADVIVGDLLFAVLKFDDSAGTGFANFPTDDAGNVWTGGNLCDIVPNIELGGQDTHVYWAPITSQLSITQEVHFTYGGVGAAPGSSWDLYHLRGADEPSVFECNHVDLGGEVWHDVGSCTPATSLTTTGAGLILAHNWRITPSVADCGGFYTGAFTWNDFANFSTDSAWTSDPDNLAQYGFDTARGHTGQQFVTAAGVYDIAGCWDCDQDSYRGVMGIFFADSGGPTPPPTPTPTPTGEADVPSLDVCGIEVSNPARAWSYLKNGLGGTHWKFGDDCIPAVYFEDGSSEGITFTDVAGSDGGSPAPWYDPGHPDSEEFLGLLLTSVDGFDSTVSRTVTQRAGGIQGGSIGAQHADARVITATGMIVASSCCGLEFGRRWIINTLASNPCDPCGLCDISVRTCAPPTDGSDDDRGLWTLYDVALVDGPKEGDRSDCCDWAEITFTLTAGNPYLYKQKMTCVEATVIQPDAGGSDCMAFEDWFCGPPSDKICCTVEPPLIGTLGAIVTIDASAGGVGGVEIGTYLNCPPGDSDEPAFSLTIPLLVQGSVLVIDSARRVITYTAPDGSVLDGTQFIQFPEGRSMDWIEVSDCATASCICVNALHPCSGGDQTYVTIQTQQRMA